MPKICKLSNGFCKMGYMLHFLWKVGYLYFLLDSMATDIVQMAIILLTEEECTAYGTGFVLQWVVPFIINYENFNSFMQHGRRT